MLEDYAKPYCCAKISPERATLLSKAFGKSLYLYYLVNSKSFSFLFKFKLFEPRHEKTSFFAYAKTKAQISCAVTAQLISAFASATQTMQYPFFLNPKVQASSHLLWLYRPVCVGPRRKSPKTGFLQRGSFKADAVLLLFAPHLI